MLKVLLVEDDSFKSDEIRGLLEGSDFPANFHLVKSVSSAIAAVKEHQKFDLIVLDMALPSHSAIPGGGAPLSLLTGGLEVLFQLQSLGRNDPCVVLTQYPEIEICGNFYSLESAADAMEQNYGIRVLACVEYADSSQQWRAILSNLLLQLCAS